MNATVQDRFETRVCETHGEYQARYLARANYWLGCMQCAKEKSEEEDRVEREQYRQQMVRDALLDSGIPPKFRSAKLDHLSKMFEPLLIWGRLATQRKADGPLVLAGPVGTGKTHAGCAALNEILSLWDDRWRPKIHYVTAANYCRRVRDTWSRSSPQSESQILKTYSAGFLFLDDLGAGRANDAELLQDLIAERYDAHHMPWTIVSTNIAPTRFDEVFGQRVADRIREGATLITVTGESRRKPAA